MFGEMCRAFTPLELDLFLYSKFSVKNEIRFYKVKKGYFVLSVFEDMVPSLCVYICQIVHNRAARPYQTNHPMGVLHPVIYKL